MQFLSSLIWKIRRIQEQQTLLQEHEHSFVGSIIFDERHW